MENFSNPLKLDLSLERLAMIRLITDIYEDPVIKERMKCIVDTSRDEHTLFPFKRLEIEISGLAAKKLNNLWLAKTLLAEAQDLISVFARKIVGWAYYVFWELELEISYLDVIYWTSYGTIDDGKIFETYWSNHGSLINVIKNTSDHDDAVALMACLCANEEIILACQDGIIQKIETFLGFELPDIEGNIEALIFINLCHFYRDTYDCNFEEICEHFLNFEVLYDSEIILLCARHGLIKPFKFFWNLLSERERKNAITKLPSEVTYGDTLCGNHRVGKDYIDDYYRARLSEMVYFLLCETSAEERKIVLHKEGGDALGLFIKVWPYHEICLKLLNEDWIFVELEEKWNEYCDTLCLILQRMVGEDWYEICADKYVFHEIFRKMMTIYPYHLKDKYLFHDRGYCNYKCKELTFVLPMDKFYARFDVIPLSIVINDKDFASKREMLLEMGSEKILELKKDNQMGQLIRFMRNVLVSDEERKNFIKKFSLEDLFLNKNNLCC